MAMASMSDATATIGQSSLNERCILNKLCITLSTCGIDSVGATLIDILQGMRPAPLGGKDNLALEALNMCVLHVGGDAILAHALGKCLNLEVVGRRGATNHRPEAIDVLELCAHLQSVVQLSNAGLVAHDDVRRLARDAVGDLAAVHLDQRTDVDLANFDRKRSGRIVLSVIGENASDDESKTSERLATTRDLRHSFSTPFTIPNGPPPPNPDDPPKRIFHPKMSRFGTPIVSNF